MIYNHDSFVSILFFIVLHVSASTVTRWWLLFKPKYETDPQ